MSHCIYCNVSPELIIETFENFYLVIDPYPICEGHMLVVTREHYGCTGELPPHLIKECHEILALLISRFSQFTLFEHGRAGTCVHDQMGPCSHMHLHFLPSKVDVSPNDFCDFTKMNINSLEELKKYFHGFGEYLYFNNEMTQACYLLNNLSIAPHLLRTIVTDAMERPELGDWQNYQDKELIKKNLNFKHYMRNYFENHLLG